MASSKLMPSSNSRNSDSPSSSPSPAPHFATTNFIPIPDSSSSAPKTVDQMWRHIVAGDRLHCKEETPDDAAPADDDDDDDEMMTLEDFLLAKAGSGLDDDDDGGGDGDTNADLDDVKMRIPLGERLGSGAFALESVPTTAFQEGSVIGFGNGVEVVEGGRGKRARPVLEHLDKAAQQRQRRMIKNRESAARSRERKQAYQVELESLAVKLEEENDRLLKEKAERKKERYKQLMEKVLPIAQKQRPPCILRRARSLQW